MIGERTEDEVQEQVDKAVDWKTARISSKRARTYEEGVLDALRWITDSTEKSPITRKPPDEQIIHQY